MIPQIQSMALAGLTVGAAACATTPHSEQFEQAQQSYSEAAKGKAAELTPDELLRAENLLKDAEAAENSSEKEVHLAYLAQRQAQIAQSKAQRRSMKDELVLTISGSVLFNTNEAELMGDAKNKLERVAQVLKDREGWKEVVVVGHTDSRGPEAYNRKLSRERARSVRQFLLEEGLNASEVHAEGEGESDPIASNDTPTGRARNRRVELRIKDRNQSGSQSQSQYGLSD